MMGYDTVLFTGDSDSSMIAIAREEGRIILTRDTQVMNRRVITTGRIKAILIKSAEPERQLRQVIASLNLDCQFRPFTICLVCNHLLEERSREEMQDRVPLYVFRTQSYYMECPNCHRIYWRGTHWQRMTRKLGNLCPS